MIQKYVSKPVVIEAIKWDGGLRTFNEIASMYTGEQKLVWDGKGLVIPTLEGDMKADYGDYIIRGIKGELYPCKPDIFEEKYQIV